MSIATKILLCIFISILTFIHCEPKVIDYFNPKVENTLVYQNIYPRAEHPETLKYRYTERYKWADKIVYKAAITESSWRTYGNWFVYTDGELRSYSEEPSSASDYYIDLKEPIEVGNEWDAEQPTPKIRTVKAKILSTNLTVIVPAGKFNNCIKVEVHYKYHDSDSYYYRYYAPKIGLIKLVGEEFENYELINYNDK